MGAQAESVNVTCAAEVFLATALLHREHPDRTEFTIQEIVARAARENLTGEMRPGVTIHTSQHCVANKAPNPAKLRMLYATGIHTRRLLQPGDQIHPGRTGKVFPDPGEVPERYLWLVEWAKKRYEVGGATAPSHRGPLKSGRSKIGNSEPETPQRWLESLFELEGLGREHWKNVDPDDFVRQLREGWE